MPVIIGRRWTYDKNLHDENGQNSGKLLAKSSQRSVRGRSFCIRSHAAETNAAEIPA